jgi:hypothetical protein
MKTRTSIYHRTFAFAYVLLVAVIFCGCQSRIENKTMTNEKDLFSFGIQTIAHDSCEYILLREPSNGNIQLIHKQNCNYCTERSKK